jgi:hypothetical protein
MKIFGYLLCLGMGHSWIPSRSKPGYLTCVRCRVRTRLEETAPSTLTTPFVAVQSEPTQHDAPQEASTSTVAVPASFSAASKACDALDIGAAKGPDQEYDDPPTLDLFRREGEGAIDPAKEAVTLGRQETLAMALRGEHKIFLSDPAGPGSLAQALNQLLKEGRVIAEFCGDGPEAPHLLYRPAPTDISGAHD